MTVNYNVSGPERKRLVDQISEFLGCPKQYLGAPSFAYKVGAVSIDKSGSISFDADLSGLLAHLEAQGFHAEGPALSDSEATTGQHGYGLTISMPASSFTEGSLHNLRDLLIAKGKLLCKALGIDSLPIREEGDMISLPWFEGKDLSAEETKAYTHLMMALCEMARNQKRITAKEKETDNDKYAFRCFLLRLGFIGAGFKDERKILLSKLSGNSAFKGGAKEEVPQICD